MLKYIDKELNVKIFTCERCGTEWADEEAIYSCDNCPAHCEVCLDCDPAITVDIDEDEDEDEDSSWTSIDEEEWDDEFDPEDKTVITSEDIF